MTTLEWKNWAGTQACAPVEIIHASTVNEVVEVVQRAARQRLKVRAVGTGHSFTPLVCCDDGIILDVSQLCGVQSVDRVNQRARIWAGTKIADLGEPLWDAGLSLRNQGDIDSQTLAGALSTATHGSGVRYGSFSSSLTRAELVDGQGNLILIEEGDPRLAAVQTSMGCLGILVNVELQLEPAYELVESIEFWPLSEVRRRWDSEIQAHRHLGLWWGLYEGSLELYDIPSPPAGMDQACYVRRYDAVGTEAASQLSTTGRRDRAYRIYADEYPPGWDEMEYFVPRDAAWAALDAVRPVFENNPGQRYPVEIRTVAAEDAWMSGMHERDSVSISVSGAVGTDYGAFHKGIDAALRPFEARPHWGKTHFFDAERLHAVYPRHDDFVAVRRQLDPTGTFLNAHLRTLVE